MYKTINMFFHTNITKNDPKHKLYVLVCYLNDLYFKRTTAWFLHHIRVKILTNRNTRSSLHTHSYRQLYLLDKSQWVKTLSW